VVLVDDAGREERLDSCKRKLYPSCGRRAEDFAKSLRVPRIGPDDRVSVAGIGHGRAGPGHIL
jgi:hypothetical protein